MFSVIPDLVEDTFLAAIQWFYRAAAVMNDTQRAGEAKLDRPIGDQFGIFGIANSPADNGVDVHCKFRKVPEVLEFPVQDLETFARDLIGLNIVDADLQVFESCLVQADDFFRRQEIPIRYDAGNHSVMANALDDFFNLRMQQRLTAADGHDGGFQVCQPVDAPAAPVQKNRRTHCSRRKPDCIDVWE